MDGNGTFCSYPVRYTGASARHARGAAGADLRGFSPETLGIRGAEWITMSRVERRTNLCMEHVHPDCVEIILCMRGDGIRCTSCGKVDVLRPGEVFVAFPDEPHCVLDSPKGRHNYTFLLRAPAGCGVLGFSPEETASLLGAVAAAPGRFFAAPPTMAAAFQTALRLCHGRRAGDAAAVAQIRHALETIILDLFQACRRGVRSAAVGDVPVRRIADEIRRNPLVAWPLDEICARHGLSKSVLITRFKRAMGLPPHAYLLACRIELAKKSMRRKNRNLTALAHELGFSSLPHFTRVFREMTGLAPTQWAESARAE